MRQGVAEVATILLHQHKCPAQRAKLCNRAAQRVPTVPGRDGALHGE